MTDAEIASMLEGFATKVLELPGVSRTRPHVFVEAKSELRGEMMRTVAELRTAPVMPKPTPVLRPGVIDIHASPINRRREVVVEVRGRRRA